jgi:hypothetical protein
MTPVPDTALAGPNTTTKPRATTAGGLPHLRRHRRHQEHHPRHRSVLWRDPDRLTHHMLAAARPEEPTP